MQDQNQKTCMQEQDYNAGPITILILIHFLNTKCINVLMLINKTLIMQDEDQEVYAKPRPIPSYSWY